MWVDPVARGRGLASRLLAFLEQTAAASGRPTVRLDTNPAYLDIGRYNDNPYAGLWFEKRLA